MRFPDFENTRKVVVRCTNWIGDAVMTTPAMGAIRAAFPRAEVVAAATPSVAELFSPHPSCDRVIVLDKKKEHKGARGLLSFCQSLRREHFDLAILFQNAFEAALISFLSGVPERVGYGTDGRRFLLSHSVACGEAERRLHHTDYYLHMLDRLGIRGGDGRLALACTEEEIAWAEEELDQSRRWIAINPGAAYGSAKRWYPERFGAVARTLAERLDASILLVGGPDEAELGRSIERTLPVQALNLAGRTTIRQLMAALSRCSLMITNDSGPMHIAAALGVPIVALFGPTDHLTTSPRSHSFRLVRKPAECSPCLKRRCPTDHRCMEAISVEDVLDAAESLWPTGQPHKPTGYSI